VNTSNSDTPLPEGWAISRLPDLADIVMGQSPPGTTYNDDRIGLPFFQGKADFGSLHPTVRKWCSAPNKVAKSGDILISIRAPVGPTNVAIERCAIGRGLAAIRPADDIPTPFLLYALRLQESDLAEKGTGSTFTAISRHHLDGVEIRTPPLTEQHRLVEKVGQLLFRVNAVRERLSRVPTIIKRFRQSVLDAACSGRLTADWRKKEEDPDAVCALLCRLQRAASSRAGSEDTALLTANSEGESSCEMDDELPESWRLVKIGDIIAVQNGRAFPSKQYCERGVRLLRPGNLHISGEIEWTEKNTAYLPEVWGKQCSELLLVGGELVMNLTAQSLRDEFLGRVCRKRDERPALLNQRICRFLPFGEDDLRPYLFTYFKSPRFRSYVNTLDTGSLIRHMHSKQLLVHEVPLPSSDEQEEIVHRVEALFALADAIEKRVAAATLRFERMTQAVLAKAFRGDLVPTEAELARQEGRDYEPAAVLLERIKRERSQANGAVTAPAPARRRTRRTKSQRSSSDG
jgi:type I restriction enzyme, S subunit